MVSPIEFAVLIPTRNRSEKTIRALHSVYRQTLLPREVVVVDDASEKEEADILARQIKQEFPDVKLISLNERRGAAAGRNLAVRETTAPFLAFLDSDDWWENDRLEKIATHFGAGISVVYNPSIHVAAKRLAGINIKHCRRRSVRPELLAQWNFVGSCSSVCVERTAFETVSGFDETLSSCQDWDLWIRLSLVTRFSFALSTTTYIDVGDHVRITNDIAAVQQGHKVIFAKILCHPWSPEARKAIDASHKWIMAEISARAGQRIPAITWAAKALLKQPTFHILAGVPHLIRMLLTQKVRLLKNGHDRTTS